MVCLHITSQLKPVSIISLKLETQTEIIILFFFLGLIFSHLLSFSLEQLPLKSSVDHLLFNHFTPLGLQDRQEKFHC